MTLLQFLVDLAHDPDAQLEFVRDPLAVARRAGLSEDEVAVLASQSDAQARTLLGTSQAGAVIYSPEGAVIYSPAGALVYSTAGAMVYSPARA